MKTDTAHSRLRDAHELGHEARVRDHDHAALKLWLRLLTCTTQIEDEVRRRLRASFNVSLGRFDYLAQLSQVRVQALHGGRVEPVEELDDPLLVLLRHALEGHAAMRRQPHDARAAVVFVEIALHEALALELVGEPRHVAAGDHQVA